MGSGNDVEGEVLLFWFWFIVLLVLFLMDDDDEVMLNVLRCQLTY